MGLEKIVYDTKYTPVVNITLSAIAAAMGMAKMYELLHKQIWRKARYRISTYTIPGLTHFKGRPVAFIDKWDIKSPSTAPYSYSGVDHTFGLNQLFVGQDPFKPYVGNPKKGIYHDDCYITPKMMPVSAEHYYWVYTNYDESNYDRRLFRERDDDGAVVIENVVLEDYVATVAGKTQDRHRLVVTRVGGAVDRIDLGYGAYDGLNQRVEKLISHRALGHVEEYKVGYDFSNHGPVVGEQRAVDMPWQFTTSSQQATTQDYGWIRLYSDGTVIQYRPLEVEYWGGDGGNSIPGHYKILPMVYTDTGDLTMPVADFVKNWTEYFELVVHEDSKWWESFFAPILAIATVVLSVVAWPVVSAMGPVISAMFVAGTAMSVVGILGGDKTLSALGGILTGVAGLAGAVGQAGRAAISNTAMAAGYSARTAGQIAAEATLGEVFSNFMSAGFSNLASVGSSVLKITSSVLSLDTAQMADTVAEPEEVIETSQLEFTTHLGKDDSEYDVFGQMSKQFEMY